MKEKSLKGIINKNLYILRGDFSFDSIIDKKEDILNKIKEISAFEKSKIIEDEPNFILRDLALKKETLQRDTETKSVDEARRRLTAGYCLVSADFPFRGIKDEVYGTIFYQSPSSKMSGEARLMLHLDASRYKNFKYLDNELEKVL